MLKLLKDLFTLLVIYLASFQMAFSETLTRLPASINHSLSLDEIVEDVEGFGFEISGRELESNCEEPVNMNAPAGQNQIDSQLFGGMTEIPATHNTQEDYFASIYDFQNNACGQSTRTEVGNNEMQGFQEHCTPERENGFIDDLVEQALIDESEGRDPDLFEVMDSTVRDFHQRAEEIRGHVRLYLQDQSVSVEQRQDLLVSYLESVLMPMRDLVVLKRSYVSDSGEYDGRHYYRSLLIEFPVDILEGGAYDIEDRITMGPNPSANPFYLQIVDNGWGRMGLQFNDLEVMSRDILTLMKAPTSDNYMRALKWMTLQMMLSQTFIYDSMLGREGATTVPRSCREHVNGDLPSEIQFEFSEGQGEEFIEGILANHGLTYNGNNYEYVEYYMENISRDPTQDGYSGLLPFENYRNAKQGMNVRSGILAPTLDDITHFDKVLNIKLPKAEQRYTSRSRGGRGRTARTYVYNDVELLNKILSQPQEMTVYEIIDPDGYEVHVDPQRQNLSTYLVEVMQRQGALSVDEVISDQLRERLLNQRVSINFPALYGSAVWRNWGMSTLREYLEENLEAENRDPQFDRAVNTACNRMMIPSHGGPPGANPHLRTVVGEICSDRDVENRARKSVEYLGQFNFDNPYLPAERVDESELERAYPFLALLWSELRERTDFDDAKPIELDFLLNQMRAHNPWARLRLGYLIAMDEMQAQRDGFEPTYNSTRRGSRPTQNTQCFYRNIDGQVERLASAGKDLGIDRPIHPGHGDDLLSRREKEYIWQDHIDQTNEANSQLFTVEARDGSSYYTHMENLSFKTLLTRSQTEEFVQSMPSQLHSRDRENLDEVLNSSMAQKGEIFFEMYNSRGDIDKQQELFEKYAEDFGVNSEFSAKLNFLTLNDEIKKPLYMSMIRNAAQTRLNDVQRQLQEFCSFEPSDYESFKTMFYMTTKSHNQLNKMAGLPSVPDSVMEKLEGGFMGMSPGEQRNMFMALGVMGLAIGAIVIGATCAGVTGGLCAPLSVAMIGAGVGAFALQIKLLNSEWSMKIEADEYERQVQAMEDLGFANLGSSDNVGRTWLWTALEATIVIPLIGIVTRSVSLGTRLAVVSTKSIAQKSGKVAFQRNAQRAVQESEVNLARYVLGFDSMGDTFREGYRAGSTATQRLSNQLSQAGVSDRVIASKLNQYEGISRLYHQGKISTRQFFVRVGELLSPLQRSLRGVGHMFSRDFSRVAVRESAQAVDQQTARVVAEYFGKNPHHLQRLLASYGGKRLDKAIAVQQRIQSQSTRIGKIPVLGRGVNWVRNMRTEQLAKNAPKLRRLKTELAQVQRSGQSLEDFILRNIDDFTDVFLGIPMRKRELPYMVFWLGAPHLGIRRVPMMAEVADGMIVRKFFTARARLVHESLKAQARQTLGLPVLVNSESIYTAFKAFDSSVADSVERLGRQQGQNLIDQYNRFQAETFSHLKNTLQNSRHQRLRLPSGQALSELDDNALRQLLFRPQNANERAVAEIVWEATPTERLLASEQLDTIAHKAAQELSNYRNMDEFERFLTALKLVTLKRNPAVVDFF